MWQKVDARDAITTKKVVSKQLSLNDRFLVHVTFSLFEFVTLYKVHIDDFRSRIFLQAPTQ